MRSYALEYARKIQPEISNTELQHIADALNGAVESQCHNATIPTGTADSTVATVALATPADAIIVAASGGSDTNPGTVTKPKATIQAAVVAARTTQSKTVRTHRLDLSP
jgi:hypothetical protein